MDFQPSERAAQTAQRVRSFIDTHIAPIEAEHWAGILKRRHGGEWTEWQIPPRVEYELTELGRSLEALLFQMRDWGERFRATAQEAKHDSPATAPTRSPDRSGAASIKQGELATRPDMRG